MAKEYVVEEAMMYCRNGSLISPCITYDNRTKIHGIKIATEANIYIPIFGMCKIYNAPCLPVGIKWYNTCDNVKIRGKKALHVKSKAFCGAGGGAGACIGFLTSGQEIGISPELAQTIMELEKKTEAEMNAYEMIGKHGEYGDLIPIWGDGREALYDIVAGDYVGAAISVGFLVSDLIPICGILKRVPGVKGTIKTLAKNAVKEFVEDRVKDIAKDYLKDFLADFEKEEQNKEINNLAEGEGAGSGSRRVKKVN
jgi:hypothetical protein